MELATVQDMRRHLEQHESCPVENCDFTALSGILERHIEANHITGLYQTVKKVWTPEDIAAWRAERRKKYIKIYEKLIKHKYIIIVSPCRFPTAANVELAKRAKEQRLKRGERLEANKARFGKPEDRRRTCHQTNSKDRPRQNKRLRKNVKKAPNKDAQQSQPAPVVKESSPLEQPKSPARARKFCGTSKLANYQHVKQKAKREANALSSLLGIYGSESDEDTDEDQINENEEEKTNNSTPELTIENPMENQSTTDEASISIENKPTDVTEMSELEPEAMSSSDEAPEEAPIERKSEPSPDPAPVESTIDENSEAADKPIPSIESQKGAIKRPMPKKRVLGLNYKRARQMTKQNTMLSKLLEPDIRHERNVLLQCVRYVCEQNFFGIGSNGSSTQNLDKKTEV